MIKESIDRQKTGQSPATPFMQMNECGQTTDRSSQRGVTFDAMETLERHSDSIDRLTSLVSKMNVKWIKRRPHTSLGFIKIDLEARVEEDSKNFSPAIGLLAEIETELEGIIIITIEIRDPTLEIDPETITDVTTEEITTGSMRDITTIDKTIGGMIAIDKIIEIGKIIEGMTLDEETGSESRDRSRNYSNDSTQGRDRKRGKDGWMQPRSRTLSDDRGGSRSRSNSRVNTNRNRLRCYKCGENDHFAQGCPNMPTDGEMGHSDSEQASLQMLTQDSLPLNSNGEVEYLNL